MALYWNFKPISNSLKKKNQHSQLAQTNNGGANYMELMAFTLQKSYSKQQIIFCKKTVCVWVVLGGFFCLS